MVAHGAFVMFIRPPQGTAGISVLTWESIIFRGRKKQKKTGEKKRGEKNEKKTRGERRGRTKEKWVGFLFGNAPLEKGKKKNQHEQRIVYNTIHPIYLAQLQKNGRLCTAEVVVQESTVVSIQPVGLL